MIKVHSELGWVTDISQGVYNLCGGGPWASDSASPYPPVFATCPMNDLSRDPIVNTVNNGIRRGIQVAIDNDCYGSAVILIYAGIDVMAFLGMPEEQEEVTRGDFIAWANRYIKFPCREQLSGKDLYGARCAMLHNYSAHSRMTRNGECRTIGYMDKSVPEVRYNPEVLKKVVLVSAPALAEAFFRGIEKFLVDLLSDQKRAKVTELRLPKLVHCLPVKQKLV